MTIGPVNIGIAQHLSRRLLPLAISMALLIALVAPSVYFIVEHRNLQHISTLYAEDLAGQMRALAAETPALWKYQGYKFMNIVGEFHPTIDVISFRVLDEKGASIAGYESPGEQKVHRSGLSLREEVKYTLGSAPIFFNNRPVGSVEILVSDGRLRHNTLFLFVITTLVGTTLAVLVYRIPLRVARKLETSVDELLATARLSEYKYRSLVSNIPDIIWSADQQGHTLYISPNLERVFGYSAEEVITDPSLWFGRIHPDDLEEVKDAFVSLFLEEGSFDVEYRLRRKDGEWIWLHDRAMGTYERDGVVYADGLFTDITARKHDEEILTVQAQELARSNAELEQFAYVASHDLQEPLRMVTSYMQLLARRYRGKLDAEADEFIAFAVDGATRMQRLINDLLLYSRVGTKRKEAQPTDCQVVLRHALDNLQEAIRESGAQIDAAPLPIVLGDEVQLVQLFQNLLANAIKFHGDDPPRVVISAEQQEQEVLFSVHDNGIGIEAKNFERIFQIFQRLHDRASYPGTGIGLAVCKKIVERHGGRIWLESEGGRGATFFFTLPLKTEGES